MEKVILLLNQFFADNMIAYMMVWQFHWNVSGSSFGSYHADFKELYETQQERVDSIAERVRSLGGVPPKSLNQILELNQLPESEETLSAPQMWAKTAETWRHLTEKVHTIHSEIPEQDIATRSFLEGMSEELEKELWMIEMRTI